MRNNLLLIVTMFFAFSVHCQNFIDVIKSSEGQTISLANDKVLEIKLPCNPSTGFGWYPTVINKSVIAQTGDWDFLPVQNGSKAGQPGTEVLRFIGVSQGTSELTLEYKRPWEKNKPSVDIFKLTVASNGKYTGNHKPPIKTKSVKKQEILHSPFSILHSQSSLPSAFSWQYQCTPIKNQGNCGSCWAFASTGSFEAIINITDNNIRSLSEQWLINCAGPHNNITGYDGCQGGNCPNPYWVSPGSVYDSELPYSDGSCYSTNGDTAACIGTCGTYTYHEKADTSGLVNGRTPTVDQLKQAIYNYGPVWVGVDVGMNFELYSGGIFTNGDDTTDLNHAVVLVGWKDSTLSNGSKGYWILRNSWGASFGEHGYMRIGYGVSAVGDSADYIIYKGGIPSCSGTPAPGNTVTSANKVCSYVAFTLSLQNFTSGKGVSYQWQSSPDSSTWSDISGATNAVTNVASQTDTTWYRCAVTCSGNTGTSNIMKETAIPPPITPTAGKQTPSINQIIWNWNPVPWANGYKCNTINDYLSAIGNGASTSYTQTGLTRNTQYTLYVWSYNSCGNSAVGTLKQSTTNTGINELRIDNGELSIYPNPVTNELIIETSSYSLFNINLTNIIGQSIYNSVINKKTVIDMSNLPNGMYVLKIYNEKEIIVRKIMKE